MVSVGIYHLPSTIYHQLDGQLCPNDPRDICRLRCSRKPNRAAEVVVVGEGECRHAQFHRALHEALGVGGAVEQGERGMAVELGVHGPSWGESGRAARAPDRARVI